MIRISTRTNAALKDSTLQRNLDHSLLTAQAQRNQVVSEEPSWEEMRQYAQDVKAHTLSRLDHYLQLLEQNLSAKGVKVVWAESGEEAAQFIVDLAHQEGVDQVVKSKSMTSEEIGLEDSLARAQIHAIETDLGDFIVQLAGEKPSHIVAPALHKSKEEIRKLFVETMEMDPAGDVVEITGTSRKLSAPAVSGDPDRGDRGQLRGGRDRYPGHRGERRECGTVCCRSASACRFDGH